MKDEPFISVNLPVAVVAVNTCDDLRAWQKRCGFSYEQAALAMGVDRSTYAGYVSGVCKTNRTPVPLPRPIALAAMAIELGLHHGLPAPVLRARRGRAAATNQAEVNKEKNANEAE